uniref:ATP synthase subunit a n=1 Tax=Jakoba libera TaxID=143017 RepID=M4QL52_JAKLI|nr:ATP synthase F0 subunit a [Jakoba libera]AGH24183.1 ATP synthase F0 subunit a [Jakoba libera]
MSRTEILPQSYCSPFEQFEIHSIIPINLGWFDISFTNSSLFMLLVVSTLTAFFLFSTHRAGIVPTPWQSLAEMGYSFIIDLIKEQIGPKGYKYFPILFTTFMFILGCNLIGMIPYTFTVTSHIIVTFALAFGIFFGVQVVAASHHGLHFFSFFLPSGVPLALLPLLVTIELISYSFRVISLAVRLFANMMSGHTLLKILSGFSWTMLSLGGFLSIASILPLLIIFALTGLELAIAFLQAYVFTTLTCIYLNDGIHLH